jgi:octaprenyl-diphosphate synthase
MRVLTNVSTQLTIGEMRQLANVDARSFTEHDYEMLIQAKTASLLSAACETGAMCGAAQYRRSLCRYGERLGMAFQVADDILDYTGSASVTGKPTGLDLKEHKVTLPLIAALPRLSRSARATVERLFASEAPDDDQVREVVALVAEHDGIEDARRRGEQFAREAEEALDVLPLTQARSALTDAIVYVMDRRS